MKITLGATVHLDDGHDLSIRDVVVDPYHLDITHLALAPDEPRPTRLVPIDEIDAAGDQLWLHLDADGFRGLPAMDELSLVRIAEPLDHGPDWDVGISDVLTLPWYDADLGVGQPERQTVRWHRVPAGEVEIRRRSRVRTVDVHDVGCVEGFVTDGQRHVTHVLVDHGHLFGHRDLVVPLAAVGEVTNDRVSLLLTRDEVRELPRAAVRSWWDLRRPSRSHDPGPATTDGHRLAHDATPRLRGDGFSRTEVREWCEAYLEAGGTGHVDELVAWIRDRQHQDAPASW